MFFVVIVLFEAVYSTVKKQSVLAGLVILGDFSIMGNIKSLRSLAEPLRVAMDNDAHWFLWRTNVTSWKFQEILLRGLTQYSSQTRWWRRWSRWGLRKIFFQRWWQFKSLFQKKGSRRVTKHHRSPLTSKGDLTCQREKCPISLKRWIRGTRAWPV